MSAMQRIENWTIAIGGAAVIAILVLLITGRIPLLIALSIVLAACIVVGVVAHRRSTSFPLTPAQTEALRGVFRAWPMVSRYAVTSWSTPSVPT